MTTQMFLHEVVDCSEQACACLSFNPLHASLGKRKFSLGRQFEGVKKNSFIKFLVMVSTYILFKARVRLIR